MNKRPPLRRSAPVEAENDGVIEGRNAVIEALRARARAGTALVLASHSPLLVEELADQRLELEEPW